MTAKKSKVENIDRFCAYCEIGTPVPSSDGESLVICRKKGLVSAEFVCGAFRYDPLKREPKRKQTDMDFEVVKIDED